jgi:hypothetical protein
MTVCVINLPVLLKNLLALASSRADFNSYVHIFYYRDITSDPTTNYLASKAEGTHAPSVKLF